MAYFYLEMGLNKKLALILVFPTPPIIHDSATFSFSSMDSSKVPLYNVTMMISPQSRIVTSKEVAHLSGNVIVV